MYETGICMSFCPERQMENSELLTTVTCVKNEAFGLNISFGSLLLAIPCFTGTFVLSFDRSKSLSRFPRYGNN